MHHLYYQQPRPILNFHFSKILLSTNSNLHIIFYSYCMSIIEPSTRHDVVIKRNSNLIIKGKNILNSPLRTNNLRQIGTSMEFKREASMSMPFLNRLVKSERRTKSELSNKVSVDSKPIVIKKHKLNESNGLAKSASKLNNFVMKYKKKMKEYDEWKQSIPRIVIKKRARCNLTSTPRTPKVNTIFSISPQNNKY